MMMNPLVPGLLLLAALASPAPPPIPPDDEPGYAPQGRRDPFVPLAGPSAEPRTRCALPGLASLTIDAVALRGIVGTPTGRIALLTGPGGQSYFARVGERLCDGKVTAIGTAAVRFTQEVIDPLSPRRSREVERLLHP